MSNLGTLYLIPVPLAENAIEAIPASVQQLSITIRHYFVENIRTARRYLKQIDSAVDIDAIQFAEINNKVAPDLKLLVSWLHKGHAVGMMSEAGCPAMADPGSALAARAHELGARVMPLVGPSSFLLALMASGFNGQRFRFLGYLPIKEPQRGKAIKEMEQNSRHFQETQIFIETPYRNHQLMDDLIRHCQDNTRVCLAVDLTGSTEWVQTRTLKNWKGQVPNIHKRPAIFLLLAP